MSKLREVLRKVWMKPLELLAVMAAYVVKIGGNSQFLSTIFAIFGVGLIFMGVSSLSEELGHIVLGGFLLFAAWRHHNIA